MIYTAVKCRTNGAEGRCGPPAAPFGGGGGTAGTHIPKTRACLIHTRGIGRTSGAGQWVKATTRIVIKTVCSTYIVDASAKRAIARLAGARNPTTRLIPSTLWLWSQTRFIHTRIWRQTILNRTAWKCRRITSKQASARIVYTAKAIICSTILTETGSAATRVGLQTG